MPENIIDILVAFKTEGAAALQHQLAALKLQFNALAYSNTAAAQTSGLYVPAAASQVNILKSMAVQGAAANKVLGTQAAQLVKLRQESNLFYQIFSGNVKQNLATLFKNRMAYGQTSTQLKQELMGVQVVANSTTGALRNLSSVERARIMGAVWVERLNRAANSMIMLGKQAQWLGRQMMVGITAPIAIIGGLTSKFVLDLKREQTELQKFMQQGSVSAKEFANILDKDLAPAFKRMSEQYGLAQTEITAVAAKLAAAGVVDVEENKRLTELSIQVQTLAGSEIDLGQAMELVRSISQTFNLTGQDLTVTIQKLNLVGSLSALTMDELAQALPLATSAAKNLNISADQLASLMAGMRQQGVGAAEGANALKFGLTRLAAPTSAAIKLFQKFTGIKLESLIFNKEGMSRGIEGIRDVAAAFQRLSGDQEKQIQLASELFGRRQVDRWLKAISALNDAESVTNKTLEANKESSQAAAYWNNQLKNVLSGLAKQWDIVKVKLQNIGIVFGQVFLEKIKSSVQSLIKFLDKLAALPDGTKRAIVSFMLLIAAVGPFIFIIAQAHLLVGNFVKALGSMAGLLFKMASIENPFLLVGLAKRTKDPLINVLAGMPELHDKIVISAEAAQAAEAQYVGALLAEKEVVTGLTVGYARLEAAKAGLLVPGVAELAGLGMTQEQMAMVLGGATGGVSRGDFLKKLGLVSAPRVNYKTGEVIGESFKNAATGKFVSLDAEKIIQQALTTSGVSAGVAGEMAVKNYAVGVERQLKKEPIFKKGFFKAFFGDKDLTVIAQGGAGFTAFILKLRNMVGILALWAVIFAVIEKHWRSLWQGLQPALKFMSEKLKPIFTGLWDSLNAIFDKTQKGSDSLSTTFVSLGRAVGALIVGVTVLISALSGLLAKILVGAFKAAIAGVEALLALITAVVNLLTGHIDLAVKGFGDLGRAISGAGGWVAKIAAVGAIVLIVIKAVKALELAFLEIRTAATLSSISMSNILPGLGIILVTVGLVAQGIASWFSHATKTKDVIESISDDVKSLNKNFTDLNNTIGKGIDPFKQKFEAILETIGKSADDATDKIGKNIRDVWAVIQASDALQGDVFAASSQLAGATKQQVVQARQLVASRLQDLNAQLQINDLQFKMHAGNKDLQRDDILRGYNLQFQKDQLTSLDELLQNQLRIINQPPAQDGWFGGIMSGRLKTEATKAADAIQKLNDRQKNRLIETRDLIEKEMRREFENALQAQQDAMQKSQQNRLDALHAERDARLQAIDDQIAAINKQNDKEQWLLQQEEYRQQREQALRNAALNAAINFRERLKAEAEGRFDDARILELQGIQQQQDANDQVQKLDQDNAQAIADRKDQQKIDGLNTQKDALQKQYQTLEDNLQKQFELEKKALDEQQALLQDQFDYQLNQLNKHNFKNTNSWKTTWNNILGLAKKFGLDLSDISEGFFARYGTNVGDALRRALIQVGLVADDQAAETGKSVADTFNEAFTNTMKLAIEDQPFVLNLNAKVGGQKLTGSLTVGGSNKSAGSGVTGRKLHSGGYVTGTGEVPAILQSGEYIINKKVVGKVGRGPLEVLNRFGHKFHEGGFVGSNLLSQVAGGYAASGGIGGYILGSLIKNMLPSGGPAAAPGGGIGKIGGLTIPLINYMNQIFGLFKGLQNWGTISVRKIFGSNTWSQHAYGNAIDVSMPGWPKSLSPVWTWVLNNLAPLRVAHAIFDKQSWSYNRPYVHPYDYQGEDPTLAHMNHVHVDFLPPWAGTPPGYPLAQYGNGAIVRKRTAGIFGDKGSEAIVPLQTRSGLNLLSRAIENALSYSVGTPKFNSSFGDVNTTGVRSVQSAGGDIYTTNIDVHIEGPFFADDATMVKLARSLEEVQRKVNLGRGKGVTKIVINKS